MNTPRIIILLLFLAAVLPSLHAQDEEWQLIHEGNRAFRNRQYQTAGSYYKKALEVNPASSRALYNMGNVHLALQQDSSAVDCYEKALRGEHSAQIKAMNGHNRGYIYQRQAGEATDQAQKQNLLRAAISAYKESLRENPGSEGTRYNLALCQKQLRQSSNAPSGDDKQEQENKQEQQPDNQPLMNYARQAEKQTRSKINRSNNQRSLEKNW